jgi:hypothetical protein
MYGMVLMAAVAGTGDATSFGDKGGCTGSCSGTHHLFSGGGCHGGIFGHRHSHGCHGASAGCTGVVVAAPIVVAPAPVVVAAPACCPTHVKHEGFFAKLKAKKHCCEPAPTPCCATTVPAVVVPPAAMPKPVDKKPGSGD